MQKLTHEERPRLAATLVRRLRNAVSAKARCLGPRIVEVLAVCSNAWVAANAYEELSVLPDAELERRGIPRGELNRYIFEMLDKPRDNVTGGRS